MANQNISLHPVIGSGSIDTSVVLHPKTAISQVDGLSEELTNLLAAGEGILFNTTPDSTIASSKTVPSHVLPYSRLDVIGGMSFVSGNAIKDSQCSSVARSHGGVETPVFTTPEAVLDLDGYGKGVNANCFNYIDIMAKKFIKKVGVVVNMGTLTWQYLNFGNGCFYAYLSDGKKGQNVNGICIGYTPANTSPVALNDLGCVFGAPYIDRNSGSVAIRDDSFSGNTTAFTTAMDEKMLYYELNTPVETDISAYLSDDNYIGVTSGDSLEFYSASATGVVVPSTITYFVKIVNI